MESYDDIENFSYWRILYSEYDRWIKEHLLCNSANIVELGCGTGLQTKLLLNDNAQLSCNNNNVFTIDLYKQFLKKAIKNCHDSSLSRLHPCNGNITSIPFKDNFANAVICMNTLDHIPKIEEMMQETKRICKDNALFIFDITSTMAIEPYALFTHRQKSLMHYLNKLSQNTVSYDWSINNDEGHLQKINTYRHAPGYVEKLLKSYGFKTLHKKGVHISNAIIPEHIQVNSSSKVLSKINRVCHNIDKLLNMIPFVQNYAMYVMYVCKLSR